MAVVKNSEDGKSNENMTNNGGRSFIKNLPAILAVGLLAALDQLAKFIVTGNFELHESRPLIKGVFSLTYIRNEGIAWGMFQGGRIVFLVITVIVLAACFYVYYKISGEKKLAPVRYCLIFVAAGSIGNMIDRVKLGYVVDFFDFELINFPVFNVADIYVTVSMILLIILICFVYKDEDFEVLFKKAQ
jgi:signal peptidase II